MKLKLVLATVCFHWTIQNHSSSLIRGIWRVQISESNIILPKIWNSLTIKLVSLRLVFAYPDIRYPDLSINFMAAKNPDIWQWKSGCCGCLQKLCKLHVLVVLLRYFKLGAYSKSNSHASKQWMVTLVSQTRSKECKLYIGQRDFNYFLFKVINWAISYFSPVTGAIPEGVATLGG